MLLCNQNLHRISVLLCTAAITAAAQLLTECERVIKEVAHAPQRRYLGQRIQALQAQYDDALATEDFEWVASLGPQLQALQQQSAQLPLSEEDYLTLSGQACAAGAGDGGQVPGADARERLRGAGPAGSVSSAEILGKRGREDEGGSA
jgi:hypothetical protein